MDDMYNLSKLIPFGLDDNGNTVLYIRDKYIDIDVTLDLSEVDSLKNELKKLIGYEVVVNVNEIKRPALVAGLVGESIAQQIEKKVNYRRAVKKAIQSTISMGANGIRVRVAGRLNGAEIARQETFREGQVPLHTLRAKIDYQHVEANTTYGIIGVKVWIYND